MSLPKYMNDSVTGKWNLELMPIRIRGDGVVHNKNVEDNNALCDRCQGTGNEFYACYRSCEACNGTGAVTEAVVRGAVK